MEGQEASLGHAGSHSHTNPDDLLEVLLHAEVQGIGWVLAQALIYLQACWMSHQHACLGNSVLHSGAALHLHASGRLDSNLVLTIVHSQVIKYRSQEARHAPG
jgi:hypothetical protein